MTRKMPKQERVAAIIEAAVTEFVEKGFEKTSMVSIAARAGISKGGVYHHFQSKDAILAAANERISIPVSMVLNSMKDIENPVDKLKGFIKGYLNYWNGNRRELTFVFLSIAKSIFDHILFRAYDEYLNQTRSVLADIYKKGIDDKIFIEHDSQSMALALCSALDGVTLYIGTSDSMRIEEIISRYTNVFVEQLLR